MTLTNESVITGNTFDKYRTGNPIYRALMTRFLKNAKELLSSIEFSSVLEIGCGPGDLAERLFVPRCQSRGLRYLGIDIGQDQIDIARIQYPQLRFQQSSAYQLNVPENEFDLVIACEVLEHLDDPDSALVEMNRVAGKWILISVPSEPMWRILNVCRGKYLSDWGNTPGLVQHFSRSAIVRRAKKHFDVLRVASPFPWTMLLASVRKG